MFNSFVNLFSSLDKQRQRMHDAYSRQAKPNSCLMDFLATPFPAANTQLKNASIVAVDFETTGLDPQHDHIVSMGCVEIKDMQIDLGSSYYQLLQSGSALPEETVVIHKITDDQSAKGVAVEQGLCELLTNLKGKILLAHHADIELGFLRKACQDVFNGPFLVPVIDSLKLAHRKNSQQETRQKEGALRLFNLRKQYHLPEHAAHNAYSDALSCAELFLAMATEISPNLDTELRYFLS